MLRVSTEKSFAAIPGNADAIDALVDEALEDGAEESVTKAAEKTPQKPRIMSILENDAKCD